MRNGAFDAQRRIARIGTTADRQTDFDRTVALIIHFTVVDDERSTGHPTQPFPNRPEPIHRYLNPLRQLGRNQVALLGQHRLFRHIVLMNLVHLVSPKLFPKQPRFKVTRQLPPCGDQKLHFIPIPGNHGAHAFTALGHHSVR